MLMSQVTTKANANVLNMRKNHIQVLEQMEV